MRSYNNKLILEPYGGEQKIKADTSGGFATIQQKNSLVGLRSLAEAVIVMDGKSTRFPKGTKFFFLEETLYTQKWSKFEMKAEGIEVPFIVTDFSQVVMVGNEA